MFNSTVSDGLMTFISGAEWTEVRTRSPVNVYGNGDITSSPGRNYTIIPLRSPSVVLSSPIRPAFQLSVNATPSGEPMTLPIHGFTPQRTLQANHRSPEKRFFSPGPMCRICHEDDLNECLVSPCDCSGSLHFVHKSCLEKWLSSSNSEHCEICKCSLPVYREIRPAWQWFRVKNENYGPQGFYADMTCILLLTPLCLMSVYLCSVGAVDYLKRSLWEGIGLAILSCFLLATYVLWFYVSLRFHWKTLKLWRTSSQVIHLIDKKCQKGNKAKESKGGSPVNTVVSSRDGQPTQTQIISSLAFPQYQTFQSSPERVHFAPPSIILLEDNNDPSVMV